MEHYPVNLALDEQRRELTIQWSDDVRQNCGVKRLRDSCPCATCREKRRAPPEPANPLAVLTPEQLAPLQIRGMKPVGNYAYSIDFSDGHNTGIYTFEFLRELGGAPL